MNINGTGSKQVLLLCLPAAWLGWHGAENVIPERCADTEGTIISHIVVEVVVLPNDAEDVLRLHGEGIGGTEIAKRLGIGRASVYRILDGAKDAA